MERIDCQLFQMVCVIVTVHTLNASRDYPKTGASQGWRYQDKNIFRASHFYIELLNIDHCYVIVDVLPEMKFRAG